MGKGAIIMILVLLILFLFIFYIYQSNKNANDLRIFESNNLADKDTTEDGEINFINKTADEKSSGSENPINIGTNNNFPSDINDSECGFYFEEYGVCGGKCASGICVNEGRSCYCQNA